MRFSITTALAFALVGSALASPGVSPASVGENADPGSSFKVDKVVTTAEIPPKPEVVLLVDHTGSMGTVIDNLKTNLDSVITAVLGQPSARLAVAGFGDINDSSPFEVDQPLTTNAADLEKAVASLKPFGGGDDPEDWINALYQIATGAITFSAVAKGIRAIGVKVGNLDGAGQATAVTAATGGIVIGSDANGVTNAIISGLKNLDVLVEPQVVSCDPGLSVVFNPTQAQVSSGTAVTFSEVVMVAADAKQTATLHCTVRFLMNGAPGGDAFVQSVAVTVNQMGCFLCVPQPGQNLCHPTTSCAPTPFGTMCLTRPGFKADGAGDNDVKVQWRMTWPVPGHEHRVAVKPGTSADTLCDPKNAGPDVCKEVVVANCSAAVGVEGARYETDQKVIGQGEL